MYINQMIHIGLLDEEATELVVLITDAMNKGEILSESLLDLRQQLKRVLRQKKHLEQKQVVDHDSQTV